MLFFFCFLISSDTPDTSPQPTPASDPSKPLIGETELPASNRFVGISQLEVKNASEQHNQQQQQQLSIVVESSVEDSEKNDDKDRSPNDSGIEASICTPEKGDSWKFKFHK
jgi:hypothetical protein